MTTILGVSARRTEALTSLLDEAGVEMLLVAEPTNLRYLTGYTGTNGLALLSVERRVFLTDFRYVEQAAAEVDESYERIRVEQDLLLGLPELVASAAGRLGFDDLHTSVRTMNRLGELLGERVRLVAAAGLLERLRRCKDAEEIDAIAASQALADAAFEELLAGGLVGRTERELALRLETAMRERGASSASFPSIVATGGHGALPHAQPREVTVGRDELVVIDWGAVLGGYCSDCTRTVATGEGIGEEARAAYALVARAQLAGLDAVAAGSAGQAVDAAARGIIATGGLGERFGHGLGHGVGLEVHEAPRLSPYSHDVLAPGDVVTVEPGVYLPGRFGIRIEDLVVVGPAGPASNRVLTGVGKELRFVD